MLLSLDEEWEAAMLFVALPRGAIDDVELRGSPFLGPDANDFGLIAMLLLALFDL